MVSARLDHGGDLGGLGHVGGRIDRLDAELLLDAGALLLDLGLVAEAVDQDVGAVLGEGAGDAEADARGGAGDDRVFPFKHLRSPMNWRCCARQRTRPMRIERGDCIAALQHKIAAASLFCDAAGRATIASIRNPFARNATTGLPRPRPRPRALHRRRAGARRGAVRRALAAADADPPPGAGGAAAKATSRSAPTRSWTALRRAAARPAPITIYRALDFLRDNGLVHRIESRNAFVACVNNHASGELVVFLICEHCGAVGEAASAAVADQLKAAARAAGFTPKAPVIEICRRLRPLQRSAVK